MNETNDVSHREFQIFPSSQKVCLINNNKGLCEVTENSKVVCFDCRVKLIVLNKLALADSMLEQLHWKLNRKYLKVLFISRTQHSFWWTTDSNIYWTLLELWELVYNNFDLTPIAFNTLIIWLLLNSYWKIPSHMKELKILIQVSSLTQPFIKELESWKTF